MSPQRSKTTIQRFNYLLFIAITFCFSCKKANVQPAPTPPSNVIAKTTVSTFAGSFIPQNVKLKGPTGIVIDLNGNVFIADEPNYCIRKITPSGIMSIFAGSPIGVAGYKDAKGTLALFSNINGLALDKSGNILAVDCTNSYIRKVAPDGTVTTVAGNGILGTTDGPALSASFYFPKGIAIDSKGNVFISDRGSLIRKLDVNGNVSTIAGSLTPGNKDGMGTNALFNQPGYIAIDAADNLYVTDKLNHSIRKIDKDANVTTLAGTGQAGFVNGTGTMASFKFPSGITVDAAGNLFVAETGNHTIRKITPNGLVTTYAGTGNAGLANGVSNMARFNFPESIVLAPNGAMYISDYSNYQIRMITEGQVSSFYGGFTPNDGMGTTVYFKHPSGMATDSQGNLYVADGGNNMIRKISPSGYVTLLAGKPQQGYSDGTGADAGFFNPVGLSINSRNEVFVADSGNNAIRKITVNGLVTTVNKNRPNGYTTPTGIFVDKSDQLFFSDTNYGWIYKQNASGNITQLASGNNLGQSSGMFWYKPYQILIDGKGDMYLVDSGNHRICKSSDEGRYFTVLAGRQTASNIAIAGRTDGQGTAAAFYNPKAIVMDKSGNLYVADASNDVIRKISVTGMVTTIAGSGGKGYVDGPALSAAFNHPAGLALSPDETILYVADQGNNLIRKITLGN